MAAQAGSVIVKRNVDKYVDFVDCLIRRDFVPAKGARPRPLLMGIDPGFGGAICVVDLDSLSIIDMIDLPTFEKPSDSRKQGFITMLDVHRLSSAIDMYAPLTALCALEEPGAMPEQGLGSTFRFGHVCGQIHGVLAGHYVPVAPVKPAVWKSALALNSNKKDSQLRASMEFPKFKSLWTLQKHHDRCEAALLCIYAHKYLRQLIDFNRR